MPAASVSTPAAAAAANAGLAVAGCRELCLTQTVWRCPLPRVAAAVSQHLSSSPDLLDLELMLATIEDEPYESDERAIESARPISRPAPKAATAPCAVRRPQSPTVQIRSAGFV